MDVHAARTARRKAIQADLAKAYTDEEACPPEWVDLLTRTDETSRAIKDEIAAEVARFADEPDIRVALTRRERFVERTRDRIATLNSQILRLNLIAPNARFTRGTLDVNDALKPLFRSERPVKR